MTPNATHANGPARTTAAPTPIMPPRSERASAEPGAGFAALLAREIAPARPEPAASPESTRQEPSAAPTPQRPLVAQRRPNPQPPAAPKAQTADERGPVKDGKDQSPTALNTAEVAESEGKIKAKASKETDSIPEQPDMAVALVPVPATETAADGSHTEQVAAQSTQLLAKASAHAQDQSTAAELSPSAQRLQAALSVGRGPVAGTPSPASPTTTQSTPARLASTSSAALAETVDPNEGAPAIKNRGANLEGQTREAKPTLATTLETQSEPTATLTPLPTAKAQPLPDTASAKTETLGPSPSNLATPSPGSAVPLAAPSPSINALGQTPIPSAPTASALMASRPGQAEFGRELGAQVSVWAREGLQQAQLQLHPSELGPIQVHIQMQGQEAQLQFVAEHPQTREALQNSLSDLVAALQQEGLSLGRSDIQDHANGRDGPRSDERASPGTGRRTALQGAGEGHLLSGETPRASQRRGLLDLYA